MRRDLVLSVAVFVLVVLVSVALTAGVGIAQQEEDSQVSQRAEFAVSDFQAPSQTNARSDITARATVRNVGGAEDTAQVQYRISDRVVAESEVELQPGESSTVSLRGVVPSLSAGTHQHGVFVEGTGAGQSSVIVLGPRPASLSVVSMQPSATEGTVGSTVSVTATIRNNGDERGFREVQYRIKGKEIASDVVTVEPGENETVTLRGRVPERTVGTHTQGVYLGSSNNGLISIFRITSSRASFEARSLRATSRAAVGDTVNARAAVSNKGGTMGTTRVEYRIDGDTLATSEVTLRPGERTTVSLQATVPEMNQGTYEQGIFLGRSRVGAVSDIVVESEDAARFTVYDLSTPSKVEEGVNTTVSVEATVENSGEIRGNTRVEYRVNDTALGSREIDLGAGESTTVRFDATITDLGVGTYQQGVFVGGTDRGQTSSLLVRSQPLVAVTGFRAPFSKRLGSSVSVTATVRNSGDQRETRTVEYRLGETVVASEEVELSAVSSETVTLQGAVPSMEPGTYEQGVFIEGMGLRKSIRLSEPPEPETSGDESNRNRRNANGGNNGGFSFGNEDGEDGEGLPGFTVAAGVIALLAVAAVSKLRRHE